MKRGSGPGALRTLVVVAVFGALLAYVLLVETKREAPPPEDATPTPYPLVQVEIGELTGVRITDGQNTLRLERGEQGWQIVDSPTGQGAGAADTSTVSIPIAQLSTLQAKQQVIEQVTDPATYGLARPALIVAAETASGEGAPIRIGRRTPDGASFYVQRDGDPALYIVASYKLEPFFEWLLAPPYLPPPDAQ